MTGTPPLHPAPRTRDIAATRHGVVLLTASVMPVMVLSSCPAFYMTIRAGSVQHQVVAVDHLVPATIAQDILDFL